MGKMFEALKKAEKERTKILARAGEDSGPAAGDGEIDPHIVAWYDRMSPVTEQFRMLKAAIRGLHPDAPPKTIAVTSAEAGAGKSVTALNLALAFADDKESRVAVVDANFRNPSLHRLFGLDNQRGLSDYLNGSVMLEVVLQRSRLPNLSLLPAGRLPGNPVELLSGKKMDDLLARLGRDFGIILIDLPATSAGTDAAAVAARADGALLVVRYGKTGCSEAAAGAELLRRSRVKLLGAVLAGAPGAASDYYYMG